MHHFKKVIPFIAFLIFTLATVSLADTPSVTIIAHQLNNPRGVAIRPDGSLVVVEAGDGSSDTPLGTATNEGIVGTGRILHLVDQNDDGDFDGDNERTAILSDEPSYNALAVFPAFHDEVFGLGDLLLLDDGRIFFTKDDPFYKREVQQGTEPLDYYLSNTGVFELHPDASVTQTFKLTSTINAIVYDPERDLLFFTASGENRILSTPIDGTPLEATEEPIHAMPIPIFEEGQQPVPAGIALDPTNGDVLVALLSGFVFNYYGTRISYLPHSARVMRYKPDTGELTDEIRGLTTAIDVAVDEQGNIYVVELTRSWPPTVMPIDFDLFDPAAPPDPGGYVRWDGRVSMFPADGSETRILVDDIDTPTNITYANGRLYVSAGLGTPGRSVLTADGIQSIEGVIYMISDFK